MEKENAAPQPLTDNSHDYVSSPNRRKSTSFLAVKEAVYQLTCLNDFVCEKLGAGFFADVYKVRHKTTGEIMVLKMNRSSNSKKQMLAEIQLLNRLSHPNILGFKGSCVHEGQLHALTEYMNGGTLEDILQEDSVILPWSVRIKMATDVAKGIAYLHHKGVFHRDLTSKNCLLQKYPDGTIKTVVADFGLAAKIKHKQKRRSYTETVGSAYWMAPECLRGKEYCENADVFSYGIILAEIMTRLPADPDYMPRTHDFGVDFKLLHTLIHKDAPPQLWNLLLQCTDMDPNKRPTFNRIVEVLNTITVNDEATPTNDTSKRSLVSSQSEPILFLSKVEESAEEEEIVDHGEETDSSYEFSHDPVTPSTTDLEDTLSSLLQGTSIENKEKNNLLIQSGLSLLNGDDDHQLKTCGNGDSGIDPDYYMRSISQTKSCTDWDNTSTRSSSPSSSLRLERFNSPLVSSGGGNHCRETSDSSEVSFHLPSPSFAWAPPSSPVPQHNHHYHHHQQQNQQQQRKSASFSFPSSPVNPKKLLYSTDTITDQTNSIPAPPVPPSAPSTSSNSTDTSPTTEVQEILGEQQLLFTDSQYMFGCKTSTPSLINRHSPSISTPNLQSV